MDPSQRPRAQRHQAAGTQKTKGALATKLSSSRALLYETGCYSLRGHEEHAEHLADAGQATRVNLADVYRVRLEELFEHYPVMRVLARRNANPMRLQRATDGRVSKDIVRRRRLLNEPTVERTTNCQSDFISSNPRRRG